MDPLAYASETPDISALIEEFTYAQQNDACSIDNISAAESARYNRWPGKSSPPDGCRWQKNAPQGEIVRPYDGRADTDVPLVDEICNAEVDMLMTALAMAQPGATTNHVTQLTVQQVAEYLAVFKFCLRATQPDLADDAELLFQMMTSLGWAVLNPGWCERTQLIERTLDIESFVSQVNGIAGPDNARMLYTAILDPTLEEGAAEMVQRLFAYLPPGRTKQVVRDLREEGQAVFLDRQTVERRPTMRTLIQGYNYYISGTAQKIGKARGHLVVERLYQADLEATAADNDWNPEFVKAVVETAGLFTPYSDAMREKSILFSDAQEKSIEIWTTTVLQFDPETKAAGFYCTTFSPHLIPTDGAKGAELKRYFAHHYLLDFAHGQAPFVQARREVTGPTLSDSRGVPETLEADQQVIKKLQDAGVNRAHLEVNPPRALIGYGSPKLDGWNTPGSVATPGAGTITDVKDLGPTRGNPQVAELAIQRVTNGTHRRFALPNTTDGSHPVAWQMRQARLTKRGLACFAEAYTQAVVLCYQNFNEYELAEIIGHAPQLTLEDVLRHRITLTFDARGLDNDWRKATLEALIQLLTIDKGGVLDTAKIIRMIGNLFDPTLMDEIMRDQAGASAAIYRAVEQEIMSMMAGSPPQLSENDATAEMQLDMAMKIIGLNQNYQRILMKNRAVAVNFNEWVKNKQHNVQETQLSPTQGRLGVAQMPQSPVRSGPALAGY